MELTREDIEKEVKFQIELHNLNKHALSGFWDKAFLEIVRMIGYGAIYLLAVRTFQWFFRLNELLIQFNLSLPYP